jgi:hypothetical protein
MLPGTWNSVSGIPRRMTSTQGSGDRSKRRPSEVDPFGRTTGTDFLMETRPFRSPDIMQRELLSAAAVVAAVGMWATLLRCPSCPQPGRRPRRPHRRTALPSGSRSRAPDGTPAVVEGNPCGNAVPRFAAVGVALEVDVFLLERAPQALDEHIVHPAPAAIHRDLNAGLFERSGERRAGELAALISSRRLAACAPSAASQGKATP